jgi:hypothetical protein
MRSSSLFNVAESTISGDSFGRCLANFLDDFYANPTAEAIHREPARLSGRIEDGQIKDAYLAAVAEELARKYGLPHPAWAYHEDRKLHLPWFASDLQSLRAVLLLESPVGFRSRNLFVSENALSRA